VKIFDFNETVARLPFDQVIAALKAMFTEGCQVPLRHTHRIDGAHTGGGGTVLIMPAWQAGGRLGIKTVSIYPDNHLKSLPGLHSTYILFDAATGKPLAMLDGDAITSRRTACASALAASYLSRPDSRTLLLLGTGRVGSLIPAAYAAVRPIDNLLVWDIRPENAVALSASLKSQGFASSAVTDLSSAVAQADIVSCATLSTAPLIKGEWLRPGVHLDLIGGFTPAMRESDDACFAKSSVFIDTDEAIAKAGDLLSPIAAGVFSREDVRARLDELCTGVHPGRTSADEITVFKAVGTALEDLASASLAYDA
jgi:ornithine cyclodeaminase/alanine dehydrogenase-like protein (mu-crystallin family)